MTTAVATIRPGDKVRNKITKQEGIVVMRMEYLAGYTHLKVQRENASILDTGNQSDENEWRLIEGEGVERPDPGDSVPNRFELGQRVADQITGFKGIVVCRSEHINHCWTYDVQSEGLDKQTGGPGPLEAFHSQRLKLVDNAFYVPPAEKKAGKKEKMPPTKTGAVHYTPRS